ncbi:amidohydrolase family protein [Maribacter sp. 2-571]|uniref:amidohydrolase family protein n=1 Tax=Maribacter sp. 2-571 TaxID=3417569 RepID=UPI003D33B018
MKAILVIFYWSYSPAQQNTKLTDSVTLNAYTRSFVKVDAPKIALIGMTLMDGSGDAAKTDQTLLIDNGTITAVGNTKNIVIPEDHRRINLKGSTIIPGIIGMHNHMRIPRSAMLSTAPKLYLAAGVTTIQTCGTGNPHEEVAIANAIAKGEQPGPEIINSGPYFSGPDGKTNFVRFTNEKMVRDTIRYWGKKGVKWLKVYRNTRPSDLSVIVDEAHKNNIKVTGHLCATTYAEAAEIGIDAIEHGFLHSYDHASGKEQFSCTGNTDFRTTLDIDDEAVKSVQRLLIDKGVALGSTLAIFEAQANVTADARAIEVMAPYHQNAHYEREKRKQQAGADWYFKKEWLGKAMAYDRQFYKMGGLLVAGLDPGLHNMPGFGDQKNYELFLKAGFLPEEAIQVMTANGATLMGRSDIGLIAKGKTANLVVLDGDLQNDPKSNNSVQKRNRL